MSNPYAVVRQLEKEICDYTGAGFAVTVNSCTMALLLAVAWRIPAELRSGSIIGLRPPIEIPNRTYVSVPQSIVHAGGRPTFRDEDWLGSYELKPLNVWDSARWFSAGMYQEHIAFSGRASPIVCVSFHASKTLGDTQGGAILLDDPEADAWFRRARFDGRAEGVAPKDDKFNQVGWHCYMSNDVAARLLLKLHSLPSYNEELPNDEYPDLSLIGVFQ